MKEITDYIEKSDWRLKENANTSFSLSGLKSYIASSSLAKDSLNKLPQKIKEAHKIGQIHIHDLDGSLWSPYCYGADLQQLLFEGLKNPVGSSSKPAKHLDTAIDHIVNYIYISQSEFNGAQAFSNVDSLLAVFCQNMKYEEVKQNIQRLIYNISYPLRSSFQSPFFNTSFDILPPEHMKNEPVVIGGKTHESLSYSDLQPEMDMINKAFLELMIMGDSQGKPFTFPVLTYGITKEFLEKNDEITNLIYKLSAKFGNPNFMNYLGSGNNPSDVRALCCRLNLDISKLKSRGLWNMGNKTGSLGVVTLNLNHASKDGESKFFDNIDEAFDLSVKELMIKNKYIHEAFDKGLLPFTSQYLPSKEPFRTFFHTVGIIGMNEACLNMFDDTIECNQDFVVEMLKHIRQRIDETTEETGILHNLEETPCLSGDTIIKTINGDIKIKDLIDKDKIGVYTFDEKTNKVCIKNAINIRKTGCNVKVMKITFDHGGFIICTPNHPIAKRNENRWNQPIIKFIIAKNLKIGDSIKSLNYQESKGYIYLNDRKRSHIHYEFFNNDKILNNEIIHHIDKNKINDSKENLIKLISTEHKKIHGIDKGDPFKTFHSREKNPFFGKHHTEEAKQKNREAHLGQNSGELNSSKRPDVRKKLSIIAENKSKEKHSHYRHDIKTEDIIKMLEEKYTYKEISKKFNCTFGLIRSRLKEKNHKIIKIKYLEELMDVYNMEVEDTNCYFIADGILVHNCEGASYRLAKLDRMKKLPVQGNENPFLTNSTHCPVNTIFDWTATVKIQEKFKSIYSGGTIMHGFIGDDMATDRAKAIIKQMSVETSIPYYNLTPTYSICKDHGRFAGKLLNCPICNNLNWIYSRVVGYLQPVQKWNKGKQEEFKMRKEYKIG